MIMNTLIIMIPGDGNEHNVLEYNLKEGQTH